ncbi:hypothetical protein [Pseudomonas donghuensis]|uniref:hypothetical protein n=1 Tax=Pseudomonas donghuensis TaxID=1163398 RepID=UPI0020C499DD|nr:hypothetical protein [Pseudomonas donghuensis]MCP6693994.1 hypothetical protein [Pseudomonas donghuensis]
MNDVAKKEEPSKDLAIAIPGALLAIAGKIKDPTREDVIDSYQFSSEVAGKLFNPNTQCEEWFKKFLSVMQDCAWVVVRQKYQKTESGSQSLKIGAIASKAVSGIGSAVLGGPAGTALRKLADGALKKLGLSEEAQQIIKRKTDNSKTGSVGLAACLVTESDDVVLVTSAVQTSKSGKDADWALFEWAGSSSDTYEAAAALMLNRKLYHSIRDAIIDKLKQHKQSRVLLHDI